MQEFQSVQCPEPFTAVLPHRRQIVAELAPARRVGSEHCGPLPAGVGVGGQGVSIGDRGEALAFNSQEGFRGVSGAKTRGGGGTLCFGDRSEEHTSELQSLMRISYAVFCL